MTALQALFGGPDIVRRLEQASELLARRPVQIGSPRKPPLASALELRRMLKRHSATWKTISG
jgi:hypothetical protein